MTLAAVPQMIVDIGIVAGVFTAMMTALAVAWKTPPVRWFRGKLSESLGEWFEARVHTVVRPIADEVSEVRRIALHHLGPNGDTRKLSDRVAVLESAHLPTNGLPTVEDFHAKRETREPFVDWNGPYDD